MTLILTWLSQERIVQVSDRRITYQGRHDDRARKCMLCASRGERLAVSYTGGPVNFPEGAGVISLEDWLFREISRLPVGILPGQMMYEINSRINTSYERAARHFNVPTEKRRLSIVFAGFDLENKIPILVCISNFERLGTLLLSSRENKTALHRLSPRNPCQFSVGAFTTTIVSYSGSATRIVAHGNLSVLDASVTNSLHRRVRDIEDRGLGHLAVREILVDTIRQAVLRRGDRTISKNCLSLSISSDSELVEAGQHTLDSNEWIMPRVVGPGSRAELWIGGDKINTRALNSVEFHDEINTDTLRAYVETNDEAKYWIYYGANDVARLTFWGELQKDVSLAILCGLKLIGDINKLLIAAHGWGEIFLERYYEYLAANMHTTSDKIGLTLHAPILFLMVAANAETLSAELLVREFNFIDQSLFDIALDVRASHSSNREPPDDAG
jgi:hypothetical protein